MALTCGGLLELPPVLGCSSPVPAEEVVLVADGVDNLSFAADSWLSRDQTRSWSRTRRLHHLLLTTPVGISACSVLLCHISRHVTPPAMSDKVVFKKSTSRPVQRARDVDVDPNSGEPPTADAPITLASKLKSKAKRTQPKSRLSFGADDEVSVLRPSPRPP